MKRILLIFILITVGLFADSNLSPENKEIICNKAGITDCNKVRDEVINKWIQNSKLGYYQKMNADERIFTTMYQVYKKDLIKKRVEDKYNNEGQRGVEFVGAFLIFFFMIYFVFSFFRRPAL